MGVSGLTRENIASHLQKYRLYLKRLNGVRKGKKANTPFAAGQEMGGAQYGGAGMEPAISSGPHMFEQQRNNFNDMQDMGMPAMAPQHDQYDVLGPPGLVSDVPKISPSLYGMLGGHHPAVPNAAVPQVGAVGPPGAADARGPNDNLIVSIEFPPGEFPQGDMLNQFPMQPDLGQAVPQGLPTQPQVKAQHDILHQFLSDTQFN